MTLAGTGPLTEAGDLAAKMVAGIGAFLAREIAAADRASAERLANWPRDAAGDADPARARLAQILGVVDARVPAGELELVGTASTPSLVAKTAGYEVHTVRWPVLGGNSNTEGIDGEGLLLRPLRPPLACVVAIPDADWSPEQVAGLAPGVPVHSQFARRLVERGCLVVVPALIDRNDTLSGNSHIRMTNQPHREFVYRMAFELGRHILGYEVQKVLALVDLFSQAAFLASLQMEGDGTDGAPARTPMGVIGYGEGGLLALYTAALDGRIGAAGVSGAFRNRTTLWQEPIYRNVWGLLRGFGDAELAALVAPRPLVIEASAGPVVDGPPPPREGRRGAAPGALGPIPLEEVRAEVDRARLAYQALGAAERLTLVEPTGDEPALGTDEALLHFLGGLGVRGETEAPTALQAEALPALQAETPPVDWRGDYDPAPRLRRQFDQLCRYTQALMHGAWRRREAYWAKADATSPSAWQESCVPYRRQMWDELIGRCPAPTLPPSPRTRVIYDRPQWTGYEVTLDLWPDVFAYGILLVPKDLKEGERRPVVVCQHGLEGRPQDTIEPDQRPYNSFAARLVERGYVVYAPQNPYIGADRFRELQRMANPLGWSLFSFIVAQHELTLDWLATLPFVDEERIAFYGLSYGGKTAMRVPALLERYCLSICSGDFNEWLVKNASTDLPMSYLFTGEYEMPEFNLGNSFNYAEMACLIAPRPFMVERGHRDGVALDEWVAFEYAKVRRRYADLGLSEQTEIAYFDGPHMIDGTDTFGFLDRHLGWPGRR